MACGGRLPLPHGTQGLELLYFLLGVAVFTQNVLCVLSVHGRRHPDTGGRVMEHHGQTGKLNGASYRVLHVGRRCIS